MQYWSSTAFNVAIQRLCLMQGGQSNWFAQGLPSGTLTHNVLVSLASQQVGILPVTSH
jgi:hypothetical protein